MKSTISDGQCLAPGIDRETAVRATAELSQSTLELDAFSYSVSHDLRAPLRSIRGLSQILLEDYADKLDAPGKDHLQRICGECQRMSQLIDGLLSLSRLSREELSRETLDLSALARSVGAELQQAHADREVELIVADGLAARADRRLLRMVFDSLLGNAWKYSSTRARAKIEVGLCEQNGRPAFFVRDNGVGFDMAYADKLFGAFQRLHNPTEFAGTGLGLATVQRVISRHGGRVWAEAAVNQGATFYFDLPPETQDR